MSAALLPITRIPGDGDALSPANAAVLWAAALGLERAIRSEGSAVDAGGFAPVWDALVGRWFGPAGPEAFASATFRYELGGRVLPRRGFARHLEASGCHDDLMTFYPGPDGRDADVMYHDRDGHVIHYVATWSDDGRTLMMLSVPEAGAPRYRLAWRLDGDHTLVTTLEIAPAGSEAFASRSGGTLTRAHA